MDENRNPLRAYWLRARWWWVPLAWLWLVVGYSAMVAVRARAMGAGAGPHDALWTCWMWFVVATAFAPACAGTVALTGWLLKPRWLAALAAALLVIGQALGGYVLMLLLAVVIHLRAGGPL